jgi:hypothetical protein
VSGGDNVGGGGELGGASSAGGVGGVGGVVGGGDGNDRSSPRASVVAVTPKPTSLSDDDVRGPKTGVRSMASAASSPTRAATNKSEQRRKAWRMGARSASSSGPGVAAEGEEEGEDDAAALEKNRAMALPAAPAARKRCARGLWSNARRRSSCSSSSSVLVVALGPRRAEGGGGGARRRGRRWGRGRIIVGRRRRAASIFFVLVANGDAARAGCGLCFRGCACCYLSKARSEQ